MSQTIWKFEVSFADAFSIPMPSRAEILSVQMQHGEPKMWALVDPAWPTQPRRFALHGTGHPVPDDGRRFVGTFQVPGEGLVFHLFELR